MAHQWMTSIRIFTVGEYIAEKQIGVGSFSTVWLARHKVHGTQVAIKEIVLTRLNSKLHDCLRSEVDILKRLNHPNIIRLHEVIEEAGKMYVVLDYCKGGDLSMFIQRRQGRIPEALAKHIMRQLAAGLKILRENNLMHRDLKPQNLLLSTDDNNPFLKIADFGFARSLHSSNLADTLCGSPLYMAPEIMQFQKYDAKADLWSVGIILFQIVTGATPFTGNNQNQLLQNIIKSMQLHFPPDMEDLSAECKDLCRKLLCRNPVERLSFQEFFNHPFLSQEQPDELLRKHLPKEVDHFSFSRCNYKTKRIEEETSSGDSLPYSPDYDMNDRNRSPFSQRSSRQSTNGFFFDMRDKSNNSNNVGLASKDTNVRNDLENIAARFGSDQFLKDLEKSLISLYVGATNTCSEDMDLLELIDRDYVFVPRPRMGVAFSTNASNFKHFQPKPENPSTKSGNRNSTSRSPVSIICAAFGRFGGFGNVLSHGSVPSQRAFGTDGAFKKQSTNFMKRIKSLKECASAIKELVDEKIVAGRKVEAFSIQLVILAIWKQALHICNARALSAIERSSATEETVRLRQITKKEIRKTSSQEILGIATVEGSWELCTEIQSAFLHEVGKAEDFAKVIEPGNAEMPDAMEAIYQSALALGCHGAVDEYMGHSETASTLYSKAVRLLSFLTFEAASLTLNPPFSLTNKVRYRLRAYIEELKNRQSISRSQQRKAILENQKKSLRN